VGQRVAIEPAQSCGVCEPCREGHPNLCPHVRFFGTPPVDGAYRELVNVPAHGVFPLPDRLSDAEGALLETLGIGIHAVDLSHLRAGQTVAVFGTGPVGLVTLAVARVAGASQIFAVDRLAPRLAVARALGADVVLRAGEADPVAAILEATGGRGVDVAFEAAGAPETPQQCAEVAKVGGTLVIIGIPADDTLSFQHATVRRKGLTIKLCRRMKHTYPRAIALVASGQINVKPLLTHTFPLSRIAEAFDLVEGYRNGVVKAVIEM
jgi:L-iditol 2-dehydrogenase